VSEFTEQHLQNLFSVLVVKNSAKIFQLLFPRGLLYRRGINIFDQYLALFWKDETCGLVTMEDEQELAYYLSNGAISSDFQ